MFALAVCAVGFATAHGLGLVVAELAGETRDPGPAFPSAFSRPLVVDGSKCAALRAAPFDMPFYCCDACHHPFLMRYSDLKVDMISVDRAVQITNAEAVDTVVPAPAGSRGNRSEAVDPAADAEAFGTPDPDNAAAVQVVTVSYKADRAQAIYQSRSTVVVPCGECISLDECVSSGRTVELWHHRCVGGP